MLSGKALRSLLTVNWDLKKNIYLTKLKTETRTANHSSLFSEISKSKNMLIMFCSFLFFINWTGFRGGRGGRGGYGNRYQDQGPPEEVMGGFCS